GAFDIYVLDDLWMPRFAGAGYLANLEELGFHPDADFVESAAILPVGTAALIGKTQILFGEMVAGVVGTIPLIVFALLVQRHLVRGLTMGAVKRRSVHRAQIRDSERSTRYSAPEMIPVLIRQCSCNLQRQRWFLSPCFSLK